MGMAGTITVEARAPPGFPDQGSPLGLSLKGSVNW